MIFSKIVAIQNCSAAGVTPSILSKVYSEMNASRFYVAAVILSSAVIGCGGAEPKKLPTVTPEQQAELDKQHAETKAKMEQPAK